MEASLQRSQTPLFAWRKASARARNMGGKRSTWQLSINIVSGSKIPGRSLPGEGSGGTYRHFFEYDGKKVTHLYAVQNLGWAETSQIHDGCPVLAVTVHHRYRECLKLEGDQTPIFAMYLDVRQPKFKKLNGEELPGCDTIGLFP